MDLRKLSFLLRRRQLRADLHGLDRIVRILDAVDFKEFGGMGEQELVYDFKLIVGRFYGDERRHGREEQLADRVNLRSY